MAKIVVTQQDILAGCKFSPKDCPLALGAASSFGIPANYVAVGYNILTIYYPEKRSFPLPPEARLFILDFDNDQPVKPFEFEVVDG